MSPGAILPSHVQLSARSVRPAMAAATAAAARKNAGLIQVALSLPGENDRGGSFFSPPEQQPKHCLMIVITMEK